MKVTQAFPVCGMRNLLCVGLLPVPDIRQGIRLLIGCTYPALGRFQYLFAREGITIADTKYGENVTLEVIVPESDAGRVREMVTRTTDGTGTCTEAGRMTYEDAGAMDG